MIVRGGEACTSTANYCISRSPVPPKCTSFPLEFDSLEVLSNPHTSAERGVYDKIQKLEPKAHVSALVSVSFSAAVPGGDFNILLNDTISVETSMVRKFYSINQKLNMIRALEEHSDTESVSSITRKFGVNTAQLCRWKAQKHLFESFNMRCHGTNLTIHCGTKCSFDDIEEELLSFIFEQRETGIPVSIRMVTTKASQLHS